jgi:anti-anti-sigma regulatory factor
VIGRELPRNRLMIGAEEPVMSDYELMDVIVNQNSVVATIQAEYLSTSVAAENLYHDLSRVIMSYRPALLVLDFAQVKMISSSSIGKLLVIHRQLLEYGGQLHLCRVSVPIVEVYRSLGLSHDRLMVFDTLEQALSTRIIQRTDEREVMED